MARAGINYIDVANAAKTVQSKGAEPTVDRVRAELGTGSKSTIAPLLKRWKEGTGNVLAVEGIPKTLADAIQALYHQTVTTAQDSFEEERESLATQLEEANTQLLASRNEVNALKRENAALVSEQDNLTRGFEHEKAENAALKLDVAKLTVNLEAREEKLTDSRGVITDLKAENKTIREHFEHFQSHISDERQIERDQYSQTLNIERQQHLALNDELISTRKKLTTADSLLQDQCSTILSHESKIKILGEDLERANKKGEELQSKQSDITKQLDGLNKDHSKLSERLKVTEKENSMLLEQNATLLMQAESASAKLEKLNDQLHLLAQEKSVIQGQFIQLQSSL